MKCPLCNSEMVKKGLLDKYGEQGLPEEALRSANDIYYYECGICKVRESSYAYQRTLLNGIWYFFNHGRWNFLKEVEFNPSKRERHE
jgi:hypothetical protein